MGELYVLAQPMKHNDKTQVIPYSLEGVLFFAPPNEQDKPEYQALRERFKLSCSKVYSDVNDLLVAIYYDLDNFGKEKPKKLSDWKSGKTLTNEKIMSIIYNKFSIEISMFF